MVGINVRGEDLIVQDAQTSDTLLRSSDSDCQLPSGVPKHFQEFGDTEPDRPRVCRLHGILRLTSYFGRGCIDGYLSLDRFGSKSCWVGYLT